MVELDVEEIGPALRYATAKVTKATRSNGASNGQGATDAWATVGAPAGGNETPF